MHNIWVGLFVVIGICLIFYLYTRDNITIYANYDKSIGTFDDAAKKTLAKIENKNKNKRTAQDAHVAGNIRMLNILEADVGNIEQNPAIALAALDNHEEAVRRLIHDDATRGRDNILLRNQFMVTQIGDIAEDLFEHFIMEELAGRPDYNPGVIHLAGPFGEIVARANNIVNLTTQVKEKTTQEKHRVAQARAHNKGEYVNEFLKESKTHTSDSQNVHDTSVNNDLMVTYNKLKGSATDISTATRLREIEEWLKENQLKFSAERYKNAKRVLDRIRTSPRAIGRFNDDEANILKYTWDRTYLPVNKGRESMMKEAVIDGLANCVEKGNIVCATGVSDEILGSLVTRDADSSLGAAQTGEQYKNNFMDDVKGILDREIKTARARGGEWKKVADSYDDEAIAYDDKVEREFLDNVKEKIDDTVEKYKDKFTETKLEKMKQDGYAAVGIV